MHLDDRTLALVQDILRTTLPPGVDAFLFGSRAHGRTLKEFSDLDICLRGEGPVDEEHLQALRAAFDESDLPFKVDVVDWWGIAEEFREAIKADLTPLDRK